MIIMILQQIEIGEAGSLMVMMKIMIIGHIDDIDNNNNNSTNFGTWSAPGKNSDYLDGLIGMNDVKIISNNFGGYLIDTQYLKMKWKNCVIENNTCQDGATSRDDFAADTFDIVDWIIYYWYYR